MFLKDLVLKHSYAVDAEEAERSARGECPLLFHCDEKVVLAFRDRAGKGRDKSYFTTHRILIKDGKGIGHKRRNYLSIPYSSIVAFKVQTASEMLGVVLDGDSEVRVWTTGPSEAGIVFSAEHVDLFSVQQFLNGKLSWLTADPRTSRVEEKPEAAADDDAKSKAPPNTGSSTCTTEDSQSLQEEHIPKMTSFMDWLGDHAWQVSTLAVQEKLTSDVPMLMQDERIDLAYRTGRDGTDLTVFTDRRLMLVDAQGALGKKISYLSIDWNSVSGFSVETSGAYFDRDTEMTIYPNILGMDKIDQDFRKCPCDGAGNSYIMMLIQAYLSAKMAGRIDKHHALSVAPSLRVLGHIDPKGTWWFTDRQPQRPLDSAEMEQYYKTVVSILQPDEVVEFSFRGLHSITLFTTKRLVDIDPKGWKGAKVEYTTIPWRRVLAFGVKTANNKEPWDGRCEVLLWTDMYSEDEQDDPRMSYREIEFNKNTVAMTVLKKYLALRLLSTGPAMKKIPPSVNEEHAFEKLLSRIGGDGGQIDSTALDKELHTHLPVLLDDENVVMAFEAGRDIIAFTNLRVIEMDVQGWSDLKIAYKSIPYTSIRGFSTECTGDWDRESVLNVFTCNRGNCGKESFEFRKGMTDILSIQKLLAIMVMGNSRDAKYNPHFSEPLVAKCDPQSFKKWLVSLVSSTEKSDALRLDAKLHTDTPFLLDQERVLKAFEQRTDFCVYTTHRVLIVHIQGTKVEHKSFPLDQVKGFEIETAGHMDSDAELYLHLNIPHWKTIKQSILTKDFDIMLLHKHWTDQLLFPSMN